MYSVKIPASITNKNPGSGLLGPVNSFTKCGFNSSCLLPDLHARLDVFTIWFLLCYVLLHYY